MDMKSTTGTIVNVRTRSARKGTLPLRTATSTTPSSYAADNSRPRRRTPSRSCSVDSSGRAGGTLTPTGAGCGSTRRVIVQCLAQHRRPQVLTQPCQLAEGLDRLAARLRVPLLQQGHDDLLEEAGLAVGRALVHAQVARLHAEAQESRGQLCHPPGLTVVVAGAAHRLAGEQAVLLQLGEPAHRELDGLGQLLDGEVAVAGVGCRDQDLG